MHFVNLLYFVRDQEDSKGVDEDKVARDSPLLNNTGIPNKSIIDDSIVH